jgi:hypothetical protein
VWKLETPRRGLLRTRSTLHDGRTGFDPRHEREFHTGLVNETHDIANPRCFNNGVKGTDESIRRVELNDLLVIVGTLHEFNARLQRTAFILETDQDGFDRRVKGKGSNGTALTDTAAPQLGHGRVEAFTTFHLRRKGIFQRAGIVNGHGIHILGCLDNGVKGTEAAVFEENLGRRGRVVGSVPQFHIGRAGTPFARQRDLDAFPKVGNGPGAETAALYLDAQRRGKGIGSGQAGRLHGSKGDRHGAAARAAGRHGLPKGGESLDGVGKGGVQRCHAVAGGSRRLEDKGVGDAEQGRQEEGRGVQALVVHHDAGSWVVVCVLRQKGVTVNECARVRQELKRRRATRDVR